jgi:hypothetical protein
MYKITLCLIAFTISCTTIQPAAKTFLELSEIDAIELVKNLGDFFMSALFPVVPEVPREKGPGVYLRDAATGEYWLQFCEQEVGISVRRCAQYDLDIVSHSGRPERFWVFLTLHNNQRLYVWYDGQYEKSEPWIECGALVILGRAAGAPEKEFIRLSASDLLRIKAADNPYTKTADTIECEPGRNVTVTLVSVTKTSV